MVRARYYGDHYDAPTNNEFVAFYADSRTLLDLEFGLDLGTGLSLAFGARNALDEYPSVYG